jgi:dimethylargininase
MRLALTREVSPAIARCELTHLNRRPIDLDKARAEHAAYERRLVDAGCTVVRLPADDRLPDSVFVEDAAVVFEEVAIITRPGAESRRPETPAVAEVLAPYRPIGRIEPPGTLDGGDVLKLGKQVIVGESKRTNAAAISQLEGVLAPHGYSVHALRVHGCLHLKSAVTRVSDDTLLVNPDWVTTDAFPSFDFVNVDPGEPFGANALRIDDRVIYPSMFVRTRRRLEDRGIHVIDVDVGELAKAEGGVTCCSLIFDVSASVFAGQWAP